ncbi:hypothetical protein D3C80_2133460 [compost metagenome]
MLRHHSVKREKVVDVTTFKVNFIEIHVPDQSSNQLLGQSINKKIQALFSHVDLKMG